MTDHHSIDSSVDTKRHIERVRDLLAQVSTLLWIRGKDHDASKLEELFPEEIALEGAA